MSGLKKDNPVVPRVGKRSLAAAVTRIALLLTGGKIWKNSAGKLSPAGGQSQDFTVNLLFAGKGPLPERSGNHDGNNPSLL